MKIKKLMHPKSILKHRGIRNVSYLTFGSVVSQIIALIGALYIPRILGPTAYGQYNIVTSYVSIFTIFTFSGLNKVILRECSRNLNDTKKILESLIGIKNLASIFAALLAVVIVFGIDYEAGTKFYIFIYSLTLLIQGLSSTINIVYQAYEDMKYIAILTIARVLITVPLSILFVSLGYGVLSLILIQVLASALILIVNYRLSHKFLQIKILSKIIIKKSFMKQGLSFSLLEFLNTLSGKIDLVMLSFLTTPEQVGIYALAYRLVEKGLIVRQAISQSFFPIYTKKFASRHMKLKIVIKHTLIIALPALLISLIIPIFSERVITTIVGDKYLESVQIFNILIFYLLFSYIVVPFGLSLQSTNNEKYIVLLGFIKAFLNIACNLYFFYLYGIIGIAYSTLITYGVNSMLQMYIGYIKIKVIE